MTVPAKVEQWRQLAQQEALAPLTTNEILAIIWSESTGDPHAENPSDPSFGLMQITLGIAKAFGGVSLASDLYDPTTNVRIGAAFLRYLKLRYAEEYPGWVAAYNEGEGNLRKGLVDERYVAAFRDHLQELESGQVQ